MWLPFLAVLLGALLVSASPASTSVGKRASSQFVSTGPAGFQVNGTPFKFIGTNVYWLSTLNSDQDIDNTFASIKAANITVVRLWAFNDVDAIPVNGTWFQLISNGTDAVTINTGPNGLQRLDTVVQLAQQHGIYLILTLTNNWNPRPLLDNINGVSARDVTPGTNNSLPRNVLSNDYGGMDAYVRRFGSSLHHDQFYVNQQIIDQFKNYATQVVNRYINSPSILSWEIANDPRCNSSIPSSNNCNPQTITNWSATISDHIRSIDPNHMVSSGNAGFYCLGCAKLFPLHPPTPAPPPPKVSPAPGSRRRRTAEPLSPKERLLEQWSEDRKRKKERKKRSVRELQRPANLARTPIRGRWTSTAVRRQGEVLGPAFDGSHGVDTEDILNIPSVAFSTFQLFTDQNTYSPPDSGLDPFNATVQVGLDWIQRHIATASQFGKPLVLTAFGLVTTENVPAFIPFNQTVAPTVSDQAGKVSGVTDGQRNDAYGQWLKAGIAGGINGLTQYQWSQSNLTGHDGTTVSSSTEGNTASPNQAATGVSPNDGYSIAGTGQNTVQQVLGSASQQIAPNT